MTSLLKRLKGIPFPERAVLLSLLAVFGAVWGFMEIADEVQEKESHAFDTYVLKAFRHSDNLEQPVGPHWLLESIRDITALGGGTLITLITLAAVTFLFMRRKHALMLMVMASVIGGALLSTSLKQVFDRERPSVVPHLMTVSSPSFPSGHSLLSAVTYLTLGALLARSTNNRREKTFLLTIAVLLTLLIGISRIFLGVHYPTDVVAGWCAGLAWATLCVMTTRWLQKRGAVEPADDNSGNNVSR